jgi:LacI family transcriptional regulator
VANRVTMADVAREAGVSLMTVSRVINNKGDVSAETRRHVLEIIGRMGYRPSGVARSLATQRTGALGLVVPDVGNPFFSGVARGAEDQAYAEGYNIFLCNTNEDPQREMAILQSLEEKRVDGLVLCSSRLTESLLLPLLARHPAAVLVNRRVGGNGIGAILIDDETGSRLATEHLLRTGHRAIGFLAGPPASYSGQQRALGYRAALATAGLPHDPAWVRNCTSFVEGGRVAARELLTAHPELTALVCYNDLVAVGTLQACIDLGRRVPQDVAVTGFDDIPLMDQITPALTTCHVPRHDLGAQALRLLLGCINGYLEECKDIVLPVELVIRASAP